MSAPHRPAKLSLAIIVHPEDKPEHLEATLRCGRSLTSEITILNTSGRDLSQLAKQYAARWINCTSPEEFAAARRNTLAEGGTPWLLMLEAGETIAANHIAALKTFLDNQADLGYVYHLLVRRPAAATNLLGEQAAQPRLLPRGAGVGFDGYIRPELSFSDSPALPSDILAMCADRSADDLSAERQVTRAQRILDHCEPESASAPHRAAEYVALGEAHALLGHAGLSRQYFRRAIQNAASSSTDMLEAYYGLLASYDLQPDQAETQVAVCLEALDAFPLDAQLLCGMGSYLVKQSQLALAARSYRLALSHGQLDLYSGHPPDIADIAAVSLSMALQLQGDVAEARIILESELGKRADSKRLLRQWIDLCIRQGRVKDAITSCEHLDEPTLARNAISGVVRGAVLAAAKDWNAALPYLSTAHTAGCRDPLLLRWLVVTQLSLGNLAAAEPVLGQWQAAEPHSAEAAAYSSAIANRRRASQQRQDVGHGQSGEILRPHLPTAAPKSPASEPASGKETIRRNIRVDSADHSPTGKPTPPPIATPPLDPSSTPRHSV